MLSVVRATSTEVEHELEWGEGMELMETATWQPDTLAEADRRHHGRVPGPFDGRRVGVLHTPVQLYDLSGGGCFVNSLHEQQPGIAVVLEIELPGEGWIRVKCETLYTKPGFGFAVRFVGMTDGVSTRLERALMKMRGEGSIW
jgi:hypothetical protein